MNVKLKRLNGKAVDPNELKLAKFEFKECFDNNPRPNTEEGWKALNDLLDAKEAELNGKYKKEIEIELTNPEQLSDMIEKYGAISIVKEENNLTFYIISEE